jgi:hypothetical protein
MSATTEVRQSSTIGKLEADTEKAGRRRVGIKREMLLMEEPLGVAVGEVTRLRDELETDAGRVPDRMRECDDALIGPRDHESERHIRAELVSRRTEPRRRAVAAASFGRILARRSAEHV